MNNTIELSDLELKVLKELKDTFRRDYIRKKLWLTYKWINRIMSKLKEKWLTKIQWFWGSWCTCTIWEWNPYCECDWNPFVWRFTCLTEKWLNLLSNI